MTLSELRAKYISFFKSKGHFEIIGKSLVPENDPSALFNTAGMQPLVPYLLGAEHPLGNRLVNVQKCLRTGDIDSVGDLSHLTFFEMLGNWSLGAYFKKEAVEYSFEFLTSKDYLNIPIEKLYISVFLGEEGIPKDFETVAIWKSLGINEDRIYFLGKNHNFWGPVGLTGPCGPDTEVFVDTGKEKCSLNCDITCSCGKYLELWNNVFMQYNKLENGKYKELMRKCVDTGMGVERTVTFLQGKESVYSTEAFQKIIIAIERVSGKTYGVNAEDDRYIRIIADHIKASSFILADDLSVLPSNLGQGYVLRRIIRRAIRYGRKLGITGYFLSSLVSSIANTYKDFYDELAIKSDFIKKELRVEEEKFFVTLKQGEHELLKNMKEYENDKIIPGELAFRLYDTYGFPIEVTEELANENGFIVNTDEFREYFKKHQEISKQGATKIFKGGLADHELETTRLHTATHLLQKALQIVLGSHVKQRGSNITVERLRFDFVHPNKMTDEELKKVENLVNLQIKKELIVVKSIVKLETAKDKGAMALFDEKYDEMVSVYEIGDFSIEVCGGPHVDNTNELGIFKIIKEQSSSSGIRRIKAVLRRGK